MKRRSSAWIAVVACLGILAAGSVHGQARGQLVRKSAGEANSPADPASELAARMAERDSWLAALKGNFQLSVEGTHFKGVADCAGIGAGSGVHCIFSLGDPRQRDRWTSTVMMFGSGTDGPEVHLFRLNINSTAEAGVATVRNGAVTFLADCAPDAIQRTSGVSASGAWSSSALSCRRETSIRVRANGASVRIRQSSMVLYLIRGGGSSSFRYAPRIPMDWILERMPAETGVPGSSSVVPAGGR